MASLSSFPLFARRERENRGGSRAQKVGGRVGREGSPATVGILGWPARARGGRRHGRRTGVGVHRRRGHGVGSRVDGWHGVETSGRPAFAPCRAASPSSSNATPTASSRPRRAAPRRAASSRRPTKPDDKNHSERLASRVSIMSSGLWDVASFLSTLLPPVWLGRWRARCLVCCARKGDPRCMEGCDRARRDDSMLDSDGGLNGAEIDGISRNARV